LQAQQDLYLHLKSIPWKPSGHLDHDLPIFRPRLLPLLERVAAVGPPALVEEVQTLAAMSEPEFDGYLLEYWYSPSDLQFSAKALLQPYGRCVAEESTGSFFRTEQVSEASCPRCGGRPQVGVLISKEQSSEAGNRDLICATCLSQWSFRRVVCANCGEQRPAQLALYQAPEYEHVRIEACDSCRSYIKSVDLTKLGYAVPLVDEVAAAPLDLWARQQGYTKLELNLVGL
jgi:formate dehydrogenase maturation protein FdhE